DGESQKICSGERDGYGKGRQLLFVAVRGQRQREGDDRHGDKVSRRAEKPGRAYGDGVVGDEPGGVARPEPPCRGYHYGQGEEAPKQIRYPESPDRCAAF